jgi:hypothetical protein
MVSVSMIFTNLISIRLLRKYGDRQNPQINEELSQKIFVEEREKPEILCRICRHPISTVDDMAEIHGSHFHTFRNPAGIVFRIRCFSSADGCTVVGTPTRKDSWFPECSWSYALCSKCLSHLGWFYQSDDKSFFGLIQENIIESTSMH